MSQLSSEKYLSSKVPINMLRRFGLQMAGVPLVTRCISVTNVSDSFLRGIELKY